MERKTDGSRTNADDIFYELIESNSGKWADEIIASTVMSSIESDHLSFESQHPSTIDYTISKCSKRQFLHVQCQGNQQNLSCHAQHFTCSLNLILGLECGIRPQLVSPSRAR